MSSIPVSEVLFPAESEFPYWSNNISISSFTAKSMPILAKHMPDFPFAKMSIR